MADILITNDELGGKSSLIKSYKRDIVLRTIQSHPTCFVLQCGDRELFLEPPPQSARSHSTIHWVRKLQQGIQIGNSVPSKEAALDLLLMQGSGLVSPRSALPMVISDACLSRVFRETLPRDQMRMLKAMEGLFTSLPRTLPTLERPTRYLQRCGKLTRIDGGYREDSAVFLFNDILLYAVMSTDAETSTNRYVYTAHHNLVDLDYEEDESRSSELGFVLRLSKGNESDSDDDDDLIFSEFRAEPTVYFEAPNALHKLNWAKDLQERLKQAKEPSNNMERFEGAVIFADVSGFSNLGDVLERKEREKRQQDQSSGARRSAAGMGPSAAEGLATFLSKEVEKMVEFVTQGGGDVIKFAGDCVIAVFPAEDYLKLEKDLDYRHNALALATGQAARVSVQMVNKQKQLVARAGEQHFEDDVSRLVAELNIHVAIGAGMVYGYHVGGVDKKWEYLIDGPVMAQVRSADADAGAGEVALSHEAHELLKDIDMKKLVLPTGNVRLYTYHGPNKEPKFCRPWEKVTDEKMRADLVQLLMQYAAEPVVEQVEAQLPTVAQHRLLSTAFCRLIGIDYETKDGEVAVMELGAITSQVQLVLQRFSGTLTRVISDDKGTSMLIAFDDATCAVEAAVEMYTSIGTIPVAADQPPFKTAIGITTGDVWIGCVGGQIRSEYTMHGSHVNYAARLMTCPTIKYVGGILCDEATVRAAPTMSFVAQEAREFKGFTEKVVSYMPKMPDSRKEAMHTVLQTRLVAHQDRLECFEACLRQADFGRRGVVAVVETDKRNHWNLDALFTATERFEKEHLGAASGSRRHHIPLVTAPSNATSIVVSRCDERNEAALASLITEQAPRDTVHVIDCANALSAQGWATLHRLVVKQSRTPGSLLVITIQPTGNAELGSGGAALVAAGGGQQSWTELDPCMMHSLFPWRDVSMSTLSQADHGTDLALPPPLPPAAAGSPATPAAGRTRGRLRSGKSVGVDRLFTLKVAAVLSKQDSTTGGEIVFSEAMMYRLHPNILNSQWDVATVAAHIKFFTEDIDPYSSTGSPTLLKLPNSASGDSLYAFASMETHDTRYRQMIFEQRARIHRNVVVLLRGEGSKDESAHELLTTMAHHARAAGEVRMYEDLVAEQAKE